MKKGLLIASIASVTAVTCGLAFAVANANKGIRYEAAKATDKQFVFNESVGSEQFDAYNGQNVVVEKQVTTDVGNPLATSISLTEDSTLRAMTFGSDGYFVQKSGGLTASLFTITIGVNNCTSISVNYGSTYDGSDDTITAKITTKDGSGNVVDEETQIDTSDYANCGISWAREEGDAVVKEVVITVKNDKFLYWGYDYFIKNITLNWSC